MPRDRMGNHRRHHRQWHSYWRATVRAVLSATLMLSLVDRLGVQSTAAFGAVYLKKPTGRVPTSKRASREAPTAVRRTRLPWASLSSASGRPDTFRKGRRLYGRRRSPITRRHLRNNVPIDAELARILTEWKFSLTPERKQPDSLVVSTSTGGPISASNFLLREFYPALKQAELPRVVFHSLRHAYETILVSTDTPPVVVHRILGHANFATTLKLYGGITSEALENAGGKVANAFIPRPDKNRTNGST